MRRAKHDINSGVVRELRVKISQTDVAFNPIVIATLRGEHCYSLCDSVIAKNIIKYVKNYTLCDMH
jgi:hypothetical protein